MTKASEDTHVASQLTGPRPAPTAAPQADRRYTVYVVPHTHWDREWYQPFQVFRARLVDVIDRVLELLAGDPRYRRFSLDGQAVVLDDYLEIRPEREAEIATRVREGRLRIGPWYVLADEFLVSPEALIRNLEHGIRRCRDFGEPLPVAYTPDSFGHIAQLPLLVAGFGLDTIVFERGVGDEGERLRGEFHWTAADGMTTVNAVHLLTTYSAATAWGHVDWELTDTYSAERAVRQARAVLFGLKGDTPEYPQWVLNALAKLPDGAAGYATTDALMVLNGSDHLFPQPNVPDLLEALEAAIPEATFIQSDVEEFVNAVKRPLGELERYQGEFRGSRYHHVLSGVYSARLYLKQANHAAEQLLEREVEPLATLAAVHGAPYPQAFVRDAWRTLLLNHPHDSICGCSVDAVHDEMMTRFAAVEQLGHDLTRRAVRALTGQDATLHGSTGQSVAEIRDAGSLIVFNPVPAAGYGVVTATLRLPDGDAGRLRATDEFGRVLPLQVVTHRLPLPGRSDGHYDEAHLTVCTPLASLGLSTVQLDTEGGPTAAEDHVYAVGVTRTAQTISLSNGLVTLEVSAVGALTLVDPSTGERRDLHLRFEDEADVGDEYDYSPPADPAAAATLTFDTPTGAPKVIADGPVRATVRLSYLLRLPQRISEDRLRREGVVEMPVTLDVSLDAGTHRVDLAVELDNHAEDHRLRLVVASGTRADMVFADGHFTVLERPVEPPAAVGWYQRPSGSGHHRRFFGVADHDGGLAVLSRGLPEHHARRGADGVDLSITLLRCVGWLSREDMLSRPQGAGPCVPTPGGQCPGRHRFELAVHAFTGPWWESALPLEAERFDAPPRAFHSHAGVKPGAGGDVVEVDSPITLSAFRLTDDGSGVHVRLWNPSPGRARGKLRVHLPVTAAQRVQLDGTRLEAVALDGSSGAANGGAPDAATTAPSIPLDLAPSEVVTFEFQLQSPAVIA